MRDYIIMTDSCCDLTDHMARELELTVVPLTVHIDGQDYPNLLDGSAISFEDFYSKIRAGKLATTSAANVGQFQDAMRPVLDSGRDIVLTAKRLHVHKNTVYYRLERMKLLFDINGTDKTDEYQNYFSCLVQYLNNNKNLD